MIISWSKVVSKGTSGGAHRERAGVWTVKEERGEEGEGSGGKGVDVGMEMGGPLEMQKGCKKRGLRDGDRGRGM
jgi:hypothetical protein